MTNYVKFLRGNQEAYKNSIKSMDTLYFVYEDGSDVGTLYLGDIKISDGDITYLVDNLTISKAEDNTLYLKNFNEQFYAYEDGEYVLKKVSEGNQWRVGLEPRVAYENGEFVLAWYEPNTTTVDGIEAALAALENRVAANEEAISVLDIDGKIESAIAASSLLSYKTVSSIDDINVNAEDAHKYIYMVKNGDIYDEYMVINGTVERIGDTNVDLSDYAKTSEVEAAVAALQTSINNLITKDETIETKIEETANSIGQLNEQIEIINQNFDPNNQDSPLAKLNAEIKSLQASGEALENRIENIEEQLTWGSIEN